MSHIQDKTIYLSFDIEDWFQVPFVKNNIKRSEWDNLPSIVFDGTIIILKLLKRYNIKATFFIVGWIAKKYPSLVKMISDDGHEIASHGFGHQTLDTIEYNDLKDDLYKSIEILYETSGIRPIGYRAPMGSINKKNQWVLNELKAQGFLYDSSIYPSQSFVHSGNSQINPRAHEIISGFWEIPLTVEKYFNIPIPLSGGFYLRFIPFPIFRKLLKKHLLKSENTVLYYHPWEFYTNYPRVIKNPLKYFVQYYNLNSVESKLEILLEKYQFHPLKNLIINN